jgi:ribosomal protein S18 acetylase RimI-like enzyme
MERDEILRMEAVAALGWRAPDEHRLGGWVLRAAGGFTGRANSVLPLGPPDRPLPDAVDEVERWYRARGVRPCFAIPHALPRPEGDPLEDLLVARGWPLRDGPGIVMTAPAAPVAGPGGEVEVVVTAEADDAWRAGYHYRGGPMHPMAASLLMSAPFQRFAAVPAGDGTVAAIGRVAVAEGWAGLTAMEVAPAHRRRGLATAIIGALARVAVGQGAADLYIQVDETNTGGRALYRRCGFTDRYRYHYRLAPRPSEAEDAEHGGDRLAVVGAPGIVRAGVTLVACDVMPERSTTAQRADGEPADVRAFG